MSTGPFISSVGKRPPRGGRVLKVVVALVAAVGVLALFVGGFAFLERNTIPVGTTVGGIDVGGQGESEARRTLQRAAARQMSRPIRLLAPGGEERTSGRQLGAVPELDVALEEALDAGVLHRLARHVGLGEARQIPLTYRLGPVKAALVANRIDERFGDPPQDGQVRVTADAIEVVPAAPGIAVDRTALRRSLRTLPGEVGVPLEEATPVVSTEEASEAAATVEQLLSQTRRVRFRDRQATLFPSRLRSLVRTDRQGASLGVTLEPKGLLASLRPRLGSFEHPARDASFAVGARRARVIPSRTGTTLDAQRIATSLTHDLDSTVHLARFTVSQPKLTTEGAKQLGIRELVSEFTTYYPCCAPRVTNIQRGVQVMDGTIVKPGGIFSLNKVLGKRTTARGFVVAPQIFNGRLEDAVGGGVSQIATTTYNAAFFAGVRIITHQPHQFYISRYPMGREATVSWGGPELIWRNDWPAAILVEASAGSGSITVRFFSSKLGRKVLTKTGEPHSYVQPKTITVRDSSLPPGSTNVVQSAGPPGFTISYTRKVLRNGKLRRNERYTWRYDAEDEVIEVGPPARPKPKPKPGPPVDSATDGGTDTTPGVGDQGTT